MAKRPIFVPISDGQLDQLVYEVEFEFVWSPGLAPSQKKKNIVALHAAGSKAGYSPILEISTKSENDLGLRLSAFHLSVENDIHGRIPLESAFQGSKVFEHGGPFTDMLGKSGWDLKKDPRLKESGPLRGFKYEGIHWELEPKTAFYDWLYLHALHLVGDARQGLSRYAAFSDIEFNPEKSINCQARTCALYVTLQKRGILESALRDRSFFLTLLSKDSPYQAHSAHKRQGDLF